MSSPINARQQQKQQQNVVTFNLPDEQQQQQRHYTNTHRPIGSIGGTGTSGSISNSGCSSSMENERILKQVENEYAKELVSKFGKYHTRSSIVCTNAAVATSQPLASEIGLDIIKKYNGNAADAAIAIAAVLAVTEPCSTGLGGDMFCLYYNATTKNVTCINGSGTSPSSLTYDNVVTKFSNTTDFMKSALSITIPGAAMGWQNLYDMYGSKNLTFAELLEPAAKLAENGFPVSPITSFFWNSSMSSITQWYTPEEVAADGFQYPLTSKVTNKAPQPGEMYTNPDMANVLRELGKNGATNGFYKSWIGQSIIEVIQKHNGCMTIDDLHSYETSIYPEPISVQYRNVRLWQVPPNGQGIAGLIALAGLQHLEQTDSMITKLSSTSIGCSEHYHTLIEMMRLGFADAKAYVSDPNTMIKSSEQLLDPIRIGKRVDELFDPMNATIQSIPDASSCTVSFQVIDKDGNAISMVNSNYLGFGTGIVPNKCGFTLQNRGGGFTLDQGPTHPNVVGPNKRPYHTIIPGIITHVDNNNNNNNNNNDKHDLYATISNMGGFMQPQGHLQLVVNMIAGGMDPQGAIDTPRFCIADGTQNGTVLLETGIPEEIVNDLSKIKGHQIQSNISGYDRGYFGRAQIIKRERTTGVLWAGSDSRCDGCAMGY
jgi:gamma-glutamyltranspeptidase / glutathione hydrolase